MSFLISKQKYVNTRGFVTSVELRALYSDQYHVTSCYNFQLVFVAFFLQKESRSILVIILIFVFNWNHETHF